MLFSMGWEIRRVGEEAICLDVVVGGEGGGGDSERSEYRVHCCGERPAAGRYSATMTTAGWERGGCWLRLRLQTGQEFVTLCTPEYYLDAPEWFTDFLGRSSDTLIPLCQLH
jgi:hypothetical protein